MRTSSVRTYAIVVSMIVILAMPAPLAAARPAAKRNAPAARTVREHPVERAMQILREMLARLGSIGVNGLPSIPIPEEPEEGTPSPEEDTSQGLPSVPIPSES